LLIDEYGLRTLPKKKPVISRDDLYLLLYTHWVFDDSTYDDERQRVQVAAGLLTAVFFGCRPCSLFDTRVKLDDPNDSDEPIDNMADATKSGRDVDSVMAVDTDCKVNGDSSTACDSEMDSDNDSDNDSDSSSIYDCDADCDTDDDYDAGPEETRSFLYRHFTISIVANRTPGKPNLVFMKATLLHTKGEDKNPRM
jgi:hypothetical protein